jgi:hypothetical protein
VARAIESVKPVTEGTYIDGADREAYIDRPMKLLGVQHEREARFGPRWVLQAAMLDSGEVVLIALAGNATRDVMFGQVRDDLAADGADAYEPVCLYRQSREGGNAFWTLRSATEAELIAADDAELVSAVEDDETGSDDPGERDGEAAAAAGKRRGR